jgi:hypothetical protein
MEDGPIGQAGPVKSVARVLPVAIAVLLATALTGVAVHAPVPAAKTTPTTLAVSPSTTGASAGSTTTTTIKPDEPLVPPALASLVAELEAFVEQARGLKFTSPVRVTLLSDKAFRDKITAQAKGDKAEIDRLTRELRALDLIPAGTDIEKVTKALYGGLVLGYYDAKAKALFVRGGKPTPAVRVTLAHELTHALQDQHFGVDRPELAKRHDESDQAWSGLVEGDAVTVEQKYLHSLSARDQAQAQTEQSSHAGDLSAVPPVLLETLQFPYLVGPPFIAALRNAGGQDRLDAAFKDPPTTSEQLIHPDRFLAGEGPLNVAEPPTDGGATVIDRGVFGEFGYLQQLEGVITDSDQLRRAAAGWGGDRYVAWDHGGKTCVRDDVVMDTPQDAQELRTALAQWVHAHPGSSLTGDSPMRFISCG